MNCAMSLPNSVTINTLPPLFHCPVCKCTINCLIRRSMRLQQFLSELRPNVSYYVTLIVALGVKGGDALCGRSFGGVAPGLDTNQEEHVLYYSLCREQIKKMHLINPIYNSVACPLVQLRKLSVAGAQHKDGLGQRCLQAGDCFTALVIEKLIQHFWKVLKHL